MKPWERAWRVGSVNPCEVLEVNASEPKEYKWDEVANTYAGEDSRDDSIALARFISAAPDMARALLALGRTDGTGEWHTDVCYEYEHGKQCENARAALRKAGVLPGT